ncbi:hypothetical protein VC83_06745 [Pseudogymnoascus destructans]|uniref:WSC domain-containing protein n=2 Tax=Pseudogymnoascus destructans TaxID=655981 RepID=L8G189_PSED2|nr:uncharacterized protein VC83_06745 [Pseudogymnoascus destructans]ELR07035.1 hypothetical protein GMDG_02357 [Pseudogymnoascus destructans 20631-21]OAF56372.2 hypothetical protein VC83_06745 [Pseudogymnoascus destructans]
MKLSLTLLAAAAALTPCLAANPTWPSSVDELEDIMFLTAGYRKRTFADSVIPCEKSPTTAGRINAAEWIRSAFHDMATADTYNGIGGLDASLQFETGRRENNGPAFESTLIFLQAFLSVRSSISDLLALSMYTAVRACGGPIVPIRTGRIDATEGGATGVPIPQNPTQTFVAQFARMGFNTSEMIELIACGHTIGGVHAGLSPLINAPGTAKNDYALFDDATQAQSKFDHGIARDYVLGNTTNPLVVGISKANGRDSDGRIFRVDKDVTIKTLANPVVFHDRCKVVLQQMIDVVPPTVNLTGPIQPYEIKPVNPQLNLVAPGTTLSFTGEIRVRTTVRAADKISSVKLVYKNRDGEAGGSITTTFVGTASGFDDSFTFYKFAASIDSTKSISSFTVKVAVAGGTTETHDNNGKGYPVEDSVILQSPQSCLEIFTDADNNRTLTIVAAKRTAVTGTPAVDLASLKARTGGLVVPIITHSPLPMTAGKSYGPYTFYSVTTKIGSTLSLRATFDITLGTAKDVFKRTSNLPDGCVPFGSDTSTSTAPPTTSQQSSTTVSPPISTLPTPPQSSGWAFLGCYTDATTSRTLPYMASPAGGPTALTNALCQSTCQSQGYVLAGTEYSGECHCGNYISSTARPATSGCDMACHGDAAEKCGGANRLSLYGFGRAKAEVALVPKSKKTVEGYEYQGCYVDSREARVLSGSALVNDALTLEKCAAFCKEAKFNVFGAEYGGECWCGAALGATTKVGEEQCNQPCGGDRAEACGQGNRLSVYLK